MHYYTETAVQAATDAGALLLGNYKRHRVTIKGVSALSVAARGLSKEITSQDDHDADLLIIEQIQARHPTHNILTEETGLIDNGSDFTWIVDPLDGSSNFVNHNPFFAVSICLCHHNSPITGVIFAPQLEELVVARRGHGCTLNGRRVTVSTTPGLGSAYVVGCPGGDRDNRRFAEIGYVLHKSAKSFRMIGSAAIEAYMVAAGRADAFVTLNISPWDIAAGVICLQEAGGQVSDLHGNPWTMDETDLLLSNGTLHNDVLQGIRSASIHLPLAGTA